MILYEVHDRMDGTMYASAFILTVYAVIRPSGTFLIFGHMNSMLHQLVYALSLGRRDGYDRHAKIGLQLIYAYGASVPAHLIHHIEGNYHGHIEFHELHGKVEIPLYIGGIHYIYDSLGSLLHEELSCYYLLTGIGRHGINPRQISDPCVRIALYDSILPVHRYAREIAHMLVGSRELVEKGGLAAVLISDQGKGQKGPLRKGMLIRPVVVFSTLTVARVLHGPRLRAQMLLCLDSYIAYAYLCSIIEPYSQFIAMYLKLDGVSHGGILDHCHISPFYEPHVKKVLS